MYRELELYFCLKRKAVIDMVLHAFCEKYKVKAYKRWHSLRDSRGRSRGQGVFMCVCTQVCAGNGVCDKALGFYFLLFCLNHLSHISIFMPRMDSRPILFLLNTVYNIYVKNEYSRLVFRLPCTPGSPEALCRFWCCSIQIGSYPLIIISEKDPTDTFRSIFY